MGNNTKIDDLMIKFYSKVIVPVLLHIYSYFLQEEQILSSKWGDPREIFRTKLWDVLETK